MTTIPMPPLRTLKGTDWEHDQHGGGSRARQEGQRGLKGLRDVDSVSWAMGMFFFSCSFFFFWLLTKFLDTTESDRYSAIRRLRGIQKMVKHTTQPASWQRQQNTTRGAYSLLTLFGCLITTDYIPYHILILHIYSLSLLLWQSIVFRRYFSVYQCL